MSSTPATYTLFDECPRFVERLMYEHYLSQEQAEFLATELLQIPDRVDRGIRETETNPHWPEDWKSKMNKEIFDIRQGRCCVVGQMFKKPFQDVIVQLSGGSGVDNFDSDRGFDRPSFGGNSVYAHSNPHEQDRISSAYYDYLQIEWCRRLWPDRYDRDREDIRKRVNDGEGTLAAVCYKNWGCLNREGYNAPVPSPLFMYCNSTGEYEYARQESCGCLTQVRNPDNCYHVGGWPELQEQIKDDSRIPRSPHSIETIYDLDVFAEYQRRMDEHWPGRNKEDAPKETVDGGIY